MSKHFLGEPPPEQTLRFVPMLGDHMTPTIKPGEVLAVVPVERYAGDGVYLVELEPGVIAAHRIEVVGDKATILSDAPDGPAQTLRLAKFNEMVVGRVAAVCQVLVPHLMPGWWAAALGRGRAFGKPGAYLGWVLGQCWALPPML